MAEAEQSKPNAAMLEMKRRQAIIDSQAKQAGADRTHRENLGIGVEVKTPPLPRHIEIAPLAAAELATMTAAEFDAQRRAGKLSETLQEAFAITPQPARDGLQLLEFTNNAFRLIAPPYSHPLLINDNPIFWSTLDDQVQIFDEVLVVARDRTWVAKYLVVQRGENRANARLMFDPVYLDQEVTKTPDWMPQGYELIQLGPEHSRPGYGVRRMSDGFVILQSGVPFPDAESARRHMKDHAVFRREEIPRMFP